MTVLGLPGTCFSVFFCMLHVCSSRAPQASLRAQLHHVAVQLEDRPCADLVGNGPGSGACEEEGVRPAQRGLPSDALPAGATEVNASTALDSRSQRDEGYPVHLAKMPRLERRQQEALNAALTSTGKQKKLNAIYKAAETPVRTAQNQSNMLRRHGATEQDLHEAHKAFINAEFMAARTGYQKLNPPTRNNLSVFKFHALRPVGVKLLLMTEVEPQLAASGRVRVITGQGLHSRNRKCKVRPVVAAHFHNHPLDFKSLKSGSDAGSMVITTRSGTSEAVARRCAALAAEAEARILAAAEASRKQGKKKQKSHLQWLSNVDRAPPKLD
ncbi:hypothetical protein JKP88DRAFT_323063 [Tribonema minus]|uniref:Smr domain-containing protein n=1 Tax=Tribonema minus TaxID=303371 RepID=A0A835YWI4_9STRA|nr:hypothetical protein JKP88DRAFT_323063 [Tribonema minus]